jgi:predicted dienelactone hydrolase
MHAALLCTQALAFVCASRGHVGRRALLSAPAAVAAVARAPPAQAAASSSCNFIHELTSVQVSGVAVPLAIWRPATGNAASAPAPYPYKIDIGKIAAKLRVGWLAWLPKFDYALPCGAAPYLPLPDFARARASDHLLFAHGFLGSVYDFAHAAEQLAADGFVVVAPELPESLTASYLPPEGLTRGEIIDAARALADANAGGDTRWGSARVQRRPHRPPTRRDRRADMLAIRGDSAALRPCG